MATVPVNGTLIACPTYTLNPNSLITAGVGTVLSSLSGGSVGSGVAVHFETPLKGLVFDYTYNIGKVEEGVKGSRKLFLGGFYHYCVILYLSTSCYL